MTTLHSGGILKYLQLPLQGEDRDLAPLLKVMVNCLVRIKQLRDSPVSLLRQTPIAIDVLHIRGDNKKSGPRRHARRWGGMEEDGGRNRN